MTEAAFPTTTDDSGTLTDGTIINQTYLYAVRDAINALIHSSSNPTVTPEDIIDEVVFPADPGPVTQAVIGFHGLNLLWAGLAVTILSLAWSWRRYPRGIPISLFIAGAADLGLIVYLLIPGLMKFSEGVWGPLLLAIAAAGASLAHRRAVLKEDAR